jgi:hypothetical protein
MGVREAPRPFQDVAQGFLPQFEVRPPRRQSIRPETARLGPLFAGPVESQAWGKRRGGPGGDERRSAEAAAGPVQREAGTCVMAEGTRPAGRPARRERPGRWRYLLWSRALGLWPKPRSVRSAAQGELSLAAVQVKRNDLCDADLELVWNRASAVHSSPVPPGPRRAPQTGSSPTGESAERGRAGGVFFWRRWFEGRSKPIR